MNFDPQTALNYAASISRPRRVGSAADEAVAAEIAEKLRGWGYEVEWQPFTFSAASEVFLKLFILASLLLVAALLIWRESVLAVGLVGLIALFMPLNRRVQSAALERNGHGLKWGQRYTAANLVARLPGRVQSGAQSSFEAEIASSHKEASHSLSFDSAALHSREASAHLPRASERGRHDGLPHLHLVAHYDSKSQRLSLTVRMMLFMLAIVAGLTLAVLTLFGISTVLYLPIGLLTLAAAFPLLFLDVGNRSPGAIDNASGVGLVLHLAEVLAQRTNWQDGLRLTLLMPSAEEMTLMGSVAYVTAREKMLRVSEHSGGLYVLNFDGVGVDGDLYFVGHSHRSHNGDRMSLLTRVRSACAELHLPLKRFGFVGALFDHVPFAQRGFDAISLIAVGRASRVVHTPADASNQLHVRGFDQAGRVALHVIEQLIK